MLGKYERDKPWRDGVFLCTTRDSFQADILESKLRSEGIPCLKKHQDAGNYLEIFMGRNTTCPIDLYVPEQALEAAKDIIVAVPLEDCEDIDLEE